MMIGLFAFSLAAVEPTISETTLLTRTSTFVEFDSGETTAISLVQIAGGVVRSSATQDTASRLLDREALRKLDDALDRDEIADVHAVLVDYRGQRAFEGYYSAPDQNWGSDLGEAAQTANRLHDLRSVSKSVATLLLGMALGDDWRDDMSRPLASFFPEHADALGSGVNAITLENALTMRSGLPWNESDVPYTNPDNDERRLYQTDDPVGLVLSRDTVTAPGGAWLYNGGLTQAVGAITQSEAKMPYLAFAEERLFGPLGITDYEWRGLDRWGEGSPPAIASALRLRPDDLAKIGRLVEQHGRWEGRQLVDREWVEAMTWRHVPVIPWFQEGPMTAGYGYMWYRGRLQGQDVIFTVGNGDQHLMIFPALDLVVTIMSGRYDDFSQYTAELVAGGVLDAIDAETKAEALAAERTAQRD